jgi:CO/xanthine dehydrogenase Mo-binding subunit
LPGVRAVLTGEICPIIKNTGMEETPGYFAEKEVTFIGDPLAIVAAILRK